MIGHEIQTSGGVLAATLGLADGAADSGDARTHASAGPRPDGDGSPPALELRGVSYRDAGGVTRLDDVSLTVHSHEVVGIAGVEGNGQSELGAILAGLVSASAGQIKVDGTDLTGAAPKDITACGVGIVPEDRHAVACVSELSIAENLCLGATKRFSRFGLLDRAAMGKAAGALMREFDVRASNPDAPMSSLSGGNQQKAVLARELSLSPLKFLLAAQPTRGLDVSAVEAVYSRIQAARDRGLGVLLISSELSELIAVSDRVAVMYRGRIVGEMAATAANREAIGAMMSGHSHA
jgi:simple sugar transport system ATP-binding protein